jgi:DNA-binding response OmpR family regulator
MPQRTILVVDDDAKLAAGVRLYLEREGFVVAVEHDGRAALERVTTCAPALIVLDLMLPGLSGLEFCRRLRLTSLVPVIMLTARTTEEDKLTGLALGADDYVTKPFGPRELVARVHAVLRRALPLGDAGISFRFGAMEIDGAGCEVRVAGRPLAITRSEFKLLAALAGASGRALSRSSLAALAYGHDWDALDRTLDAHIMKLRRKLEPSGLAPTIETVFGIGYRFNPSAARLA